MKSMTCLEVLLRAIMGLVIINKYVEEENDFVPRNEAIGHGVI